MHKFLNSEKLLESARLSIPLGSQTFSKSITQLPFGVSPYFAKSAKGSKLIDVDDNQYIDFISALAAVNIGYLDEDITKAVIEQVQKGSIFSLSSELEIALAQKLNEIIPCSEMVRFGKNGSDVTSAAIRIARAYTKKDLVVVCGYHGWQDWYISSTTRNKGIPKDICKLTKKFNYNDIDSLKKIFKENKDNIACVILEPMNIKYPENNFLEKVKEITHQNNALLIFDEMITGFRFGLGGASEYFEITPDLATFGKAMANGYPISAICGKKEYMRMFEEVFFSFTFGGELTSIAASLATIEKIQKFNIIEDFVKKGNKIINGLQDIIDCNGLRSYFAISGHPSWSFLTFKPNDIYSDYDIKTLFLQEAFQNGIMTLGTHNLMFAHNDQDIDNLLKIYQKLLPKIADIIKNKELDKYLKCQPLVPLFKVR
jgi:glutamate-1-semialdehyde 2,1-aminomutase